MIPRAPAIHSLTSQAPAFGEDDWRVCCTWDIIEKDSGRV
jgi:hypothetical protein